MAVDDDVAVVDASVILPVVPSFMETSQRQPDVQLPYRDRSSTEQLQREHEFIFYQATKRTAVQCGPTLQFIKRASK